MYNISNKFGKIQDGWLGTVSNNDETITISYDLHSYTDSDSILISYIDGFNNMKHLFIKNPNSEDMSVNHNDFIPYENYQEITFPDYSFMSFNLYGFEPNDESKYKSFLISSHDHYISSNQPTTAKLGFSNEFERYYFYIWINLRNKYTYSTTEIGNSIKPISIPPKPNLDIITKTMTDFQFKVDTEFTSSASVWRYFKESESNPPQSEYLTEWKISVPKNETFNLVELPLEITENYPNINLDKLEYLRTELFNIENKDGYSSSEIKIVYE
ncbi:hypothetical protein [Maribacter ulvicola]|uniref:Uncharacterized protein n=1 Tax=Maribacter ulvicola TaxID=228959 RepID=A0A1N6PUT5_9FLAO|nr:hypothetical protein [Maribacter ulvicola]SIQ07979.1 hypothetical protein SAMN05421797_101602 [Maribacter ulvicola]